MISSVTVAMDSNTFDRSLVMLAGGNIVARFDNGAAPQLPRTVYDVPDAAVPISHTIHVSTAVYVIM